MRKFILTFFGLFLFASIFAQTGSIDNIQVQQRSDGSGLVDVYFDLSGPEDSYLIGLRVSFDAGDSYWAVDNSTLSGDAGTIPPGPNKHIVWDPSQQFPNRYSPITKLKITAYIQNNMNPCSGSPTITDYDGNTYNTVQIGDQCWMKENLNTTRDANGNTITRYCYDDDNNWCDLYGGLYKWSTVMNGEVSSNGNPSGVQGICPNGWHVPSDAEWTELTDFLTTTYPDIHDDNVGDKLKSCRQVNSPVEGGCNTNEHPRWNENAYYFGTNDFGFSSLPGGSYENGYDNLGSCGYWWSATQSSTSYAWYQKMVYSSGGVYRYNDSKTLRFSLRCLRD